jgi:hypothetical protein
LTYHIIQYITSLFGRKPASTKGHLGRTVHSIFRLNIDAYLECVSWNEPLSLVLAVFERSMIAIEENCHGASSIVLGCVCHCLTNVGPDGAHGWTRHPI